MINSKDINQLKHHPYTTQPSTTLTLGAQSLDQGACTQSKSSSSLEAKRGLVDHLECAGQEVEEEAG
jgi:hypothetical protein